MKYVYILTSSEKDTYYEQFFLSLASFRLFNPEAELIVLFDKKTRQGLSDKRSGYKKFISEEKVLTVPEKFTQKEASRWIKTSIHHYISGDFLFVDCDTIITEKLQCDFPEAVKIGAVLDNHTTLENHHLRNHFQREDRTIGFSSSVKTNIRYNGGLIFCRDDPDSLAFYEKWHSLWIESRKKGCSQDMPSLNQANIEAENIITELDGTWNCQISHNGLPYLSDAKIIHYYATSLTSLHPAYILAAPKTFAAITGTGDIPPHLMKYLENPKAAFEPLSRIISDKATIDAFDNSIFFKLSRLSRRIRNFFTA